MPTGYTSDLYEGKDVTFAEFALRCARGMGAAVLLRDSDANVVPTPSNVRSSSYAQRRLLETQAELARCEKLDLNGWLAETERYNNETIRARDETIAKNERLRAAYEGMIEQVEAWKPPSEDHVYFKEFMLEELMRSLKFDVHDDIKGWYRTRTVEEHREETLAKLRRDVEYYSEDAENDRKRDETRSEWVRQLYESLGVAVES